MNGVVDRRCTASELPSDGLEATLARRVDAVRGADDAALALLYAPSSVALVRVVSGGAVETAKGALLPLDDVYEARVFGPDGELRWHRSAAGDVRAVLLTDVPIGADDPPRSVGRRTRRTLLAGEAVDGAADGWTRLASHAVGALDAPVGGAGRSARVWLVSHEYLEQVDEHGNVAVVEELLRGLEVVPAVEVRATSDAEGSDDG